jgi:hypothetical protein
VALVWHVHPFAKVTLVDDVVVVNEDDALEVERDGAGEVVVIDHAQRRKHRLALEERDLRLQRVRQLVEDLVLVEHLAVGKA